MADGATFCAYCGALVQSAPHAPPEPEPPSVTVLIEPGAGVWAPAPEAASAPEDAASAPIPAGPAPAVAAVPAAAILAPQPIVTVAYAGFWRRFAAYWIDWFIFFSIELFIAYTRGIPLSARQDVEPVEFAKGAFLGLLIGWLYSATLESSPWQATLGKRAMDIYVTDRQGRRLGFAQATGRYFGKLISAIILGIGFIMIAFTERKQALHDLLAGCLVVRRRG